MARRIKPLTTMSLTDESPAPWKITDRRQEALKTDYLTHEQAVEMARAIARLSREA